MRDLNLYHDVDVIKNKLEIKNIEKLENAEAAITLNTLAMLKNFEEGKFDFEKLKVIDKLHFWRYI